MENRINKHITESGETKSIFGNFSVQMESGNARAGELITYPIDAFEKMETFFEWEWFHSFSTNFFNKGDNVFWIGSCISEDFAAYFQDNNLTHNRVLRLSQGLNSARGLEVYLRWLFDDEHVPLGDNPPWEGYKDKQCALSPRDREMIRAQLTNIHKVVIFTGTVDVAHDSVTGQDLYQFPPNQYYDKTRHIVRRLGIVETVQCYQNIVNLIKKHLGTEPLFLIPPYHHSSQSFEGDLPPLPLTYMSKSVMRSALHEVCPTMYFPFNEMVSEYFVRYTDKGLHIHGEITNLMTRILATWYGDFDNNPDSRKDVVDRFNYLRKKFLVGALQNRALPAEHIDPPQKTKYTQVTGEFTPPE